MQCLPATASAYCLLLTAYWSGRGGQNRTVTTSSQDSDARVTPHPAEHCELRNSNCEFQAAGVSSRIRNTKFAIEKLVRQVRLELTIPCLRGRCLSRFGY